jgi:hypothetical protein
VKYYGLVETEGKAKHKRVKITDLGFKIIMDQREEERCLALREAALKPSMFNIIHTKYPESLPGDDALRHDLIFLYEFNDKSVPDFLKVFKETLEFAKVYESDIIGGEHEGAEEEIAPTGKEKGGTKMTQFEIGLAPKATNIRNVLSFNEFSPGLSFQLSSIGGNSAITQKSIDKLIKLLQLVKEDYPETWAAADESKKDTGETANAKVKAGHLLFEDPSKNG